MIGQLRNKLRSFTRNWATTQDLLQDVQVRLLTCAVQDPVSAPAMIQQIALNVGRDWQRREKLRRVVEFHPDLEELPHPEFSLSPERYAIARQLLEKVIACLPARCAHALGLVKGEGYSYKEAAAEMKITVNTVHAHLRDALLLIRRARLEIGDL